MPQARRAANRALQLDETLAAAHVSLGYVKALYDWDWPGAEREFKRALELSPGDADVRFAYSVTYLTPLGRLDEALAEIQRALALDPLSPYKITGAGMIYSDRREYDRAVEQFRKAIERGVETVRGRPAAAHAVMQAMRAAFPNVDDASVRARLAAQQGRQVEARGLIENWIRECNRTERPGKSCYAAQVYASIGEKDLAFEWLEKAYEERSPLLVYAKVMPYYDTCAPTRGSPPCSSVSAWGVERGSTFKPSHFANSADQQQPAHRDAHQRKRGRFGRAGTDLQIKVDRSFQGEERRAAVAKPTIAKGYRARHIGNVSRGSQRVGAAITRGIGAIDAWVSATHKGIPGDCCGLGSVDVAADAVPIESKDVIR
jgi:hypothetical protein